MGIVELTNGNGGGGQIGGGRGMQTGFGAAQVQDCGTQFEIGWHAYWQLLFAWATGNEFGDPKLLLLETVSPKINSSRVDPLVVVSLSNEDISVVVLAKWIGGSLNGPKILNLDGFESSK